MISQNPIKEYKKGMPCMLGELVGRIIGESDTGSWGYINDVYMYSMPLFSTPQGTVFKTGVLHLSDINDEVAAKLYGYEDQVLREGKELYAGLLPEMFSPNNLYLTIKHVRFTGKWVEFWFNENIPTITNESESYQLASRGEYLWDAVEKAGIYNEVANNGLVGRKIYWQKQGTNYEILKIE